MGAISKIPQGKKAAIDMKNELNERIENDTFYRILCFLIRNKNFWVSFCEMTGLKATVGPLMPSEKFLLIHKTMFQLAGVLLGIATLMTQGILLGLFVTIFYQYLFFFVVMYYEDQLTERQDKIAREWDPTFHKSLLCLADGMFEINPDRRFLWPFGHLDDWRNTPEIKLHAKATFEYNADLSDDPIGNFPKIYKLGYRHTVYGIVPSDYVMMRNGFHKWMTDSLPEGEYDEISK